VGSLASSAINMGGNAILRGQAAGFFSPGPSRGFEFDRTGYQPSHSLLSDMPSSSPGSGYSLLNDQPSGPSYGLRPEAGPSLGDRFSRLGVSAASKLGSSVASRATGSALTPSPRVAPPNPYESYGYTPYWMRQ
jgi:hypothetical protein